MLFLLQHKGWSLPNYATNQWNNSGDIAVYHAKISFFYHVSSFIMETYTVWSYWLQEFKHILKNKAIFLNCQVFQREIYFYFLEDACITCNHAWHITWCICQTYTKGNWVWFCVNRLWGKLLLNITWLVAVQCVSHAGKVIKTNLRLVNRPCVECTVDGYSK